jgi:hypothetical protein
MRGGDIGAQREVLAALIERVVAVRVERGTCEVEIVWTAGGEGPRAAPPSVSALDYRCVA